MPALPHTSLPWPEPGLNPRRRELLSITLCTPLAAAGALFAPAASLAHAEASAPLPPPAPGRAGYHTSEHTTAYYSSLRY